MRTYALTHNLELERQIIGQSLLDQRVASYEIDVMDFYDAMHQHLWQAICGLDEDKADINPFSVLEAAVAAGMSKIPVSQLMSMTTGLVVNLGLNGHVRQLKTHAARRQLLKDCIHITGQLESEGDLTYVLDELEGYLVRARTELVPKESRFVSLAEVIDQEVKPALRDLVHGQTQKIRTGFDALDRAIGGGFTPSDVILVVSDTGNGKSAFVLQLGDQLASQGNPVAYVSGEMRNRENGLRLVSQNANVTNLNSVVKISDTDCDIFSDWADHIKNRPIFFDHSSGDLQTIKTNLKALIQKQGIRVLIMDYIQLYRLTPRDKFGRTERLTEVSQEIKRIANEFGLCVIEVAQFNREGAKSHKPTMHDLEGSGQLEKDCSLIFIIDRPEDSDDIDLRIVKGRNSGKCVLNGRFEGRTLKFSL